MFNKEEAKLREEIEKLIKEKIGSIPIDLTPYIRKLILKKELKARLQQLLADKKMFGDAVKGSREKLADLEHQQWMSWTKYLNANHKIPIELLKKWEKNWKPYSELDEKTKDSDRIWADKIIKELLKTLGVEE